MQFSLFWPLSAALVGFRCWRFAIFLFHPFICCRQDFKFFSEMDGIFRKQLKADDSDSDLLVPEEPEDSVAEPELSRGGVFTLGMGGC